MVAFAVTNNQIIRLTNADSGFSGGAGAESDFVYQGSFSQSDQVKTSSLFNYYTHGTTWNYVTTERIWISKTIATNKDILADHGLQVRVGDTASDTYNWQVANADTYFIAGGWLIKCVNPNISRFRYTTSGTPDLTIVDVYGAASQFTATSRVENMGQDAIDVVLVGNGLEGTGGDGANTDGTFQDYIDFDDGNYLNRFGIATAFNGVFFINGFLHIGSSTQSTEFTDSNKVLVFPDHYVSNGSCGIASHIHRSNTHIVIDSCVLNGRGQLYGNSSVGDDTRPDYVVYGANGTFNGSSTTFDTFRRCVFNGNCTVDSTTFLSGQEIIANGASLLSASFSDCTGDANTSYLNWNINLNTNGLLDGATFTRGTTNTHAIALGTNSPTSVDLNNITYSGYNAHNGNEDSAIHVQRTSGTVTLNVTGGTSPTYLSEGADVNIVTGAVTVKATALYQNTSPTANARVLIQASAPGAFPYQNTVTIVNTGTNANVAHTGHGMATGDYVAIKGPSHVENRGVHQITVTDANYYYYTMASAPGSSPTGTITSTFVALYGNTDGSGVIQTSRVYTANQDVTGVIRKASFSPYYKTAPVAGTITSTGGFTATGVLIIDE